RAPSSGTWRTGCSSTATAPSSSPERRTAGFGGSTSRADAWGAVYRRWAGGQVLVQRCVVPEARGQRVGLLKRDPPQQPQALGRQSQRRSRRRQRRDHGATAVTHRRRHRRAPWFELVDDRPVTLLAE